MASPSPTFRYAIDPGRRLVADEFVGEVDYRFILEKTRILWSDPAWNEQYSGLADLSRCSMRMTPDEIRMLFHDVVSDGRNAKGKVALIVNDPLNTALSMLFKNLSTPRYDLSLFHEWESACRFVKAEVAKEELPWKWA